MHNAQIKLENLLLPEIWILGGECVRNMFIYGERIQFLCGKNGSKIPHYLKLRELVQLYKYLTRFRFIIVCYLNISFYFQYSVLLFLLLVSQIILGVLVLTNKHQLEQAFEKLINNFWKEKDTHQNFWDTLQRSVSSLSLLDVQTIR